MISVSAPALPRLTSTLGFPSVTPLSPSLFFFPPLHLPRLLLWTPPGPSSSNKPTLHSPLTPAAVPPLPPPPPPTLSPHLALTPPTQFQMAHLVPLKPYAAPVPRSQSLCDQPTKTMSAFPTQDPSPTPTPRPMHSRELVRQNSDPTSESPGPQQRPVRDEHGPWIRLPEIEPPPKVRIHVSIHTCVYSGAC